MENQDLKKKKRKKKKVTSYLDTIKELADFSVDNLEDNEDMIKQYEARMERREKDEQKIPKIWESQQFFGRLIYDDISPCEEQTPLLSVTMFCNSHSFVKTRFKNRLLKISELVKMVKQEEDKKNQFM